MASVFISYSHADTTFVGKFAQRLQEAEITVSMDREFDSGGPLIERIAAAIHKVDFVLACLSSHSVRSRWVNTEMQIAMTREIEGERVVVVPVLLPSLGTVEEIPWFLRHKLYVDFRDKSHFAEELERLVYRLNRSPLEPTSLREMDGTTVDAEVADRLVESAHRSRSVRPLVINYLLEALATRRRATERYWAYVALAEIGGDEAAAAIAKGLADSNPFARQGAQDAWKLLGQPPVGQQGTSEN